MKHCTLVAVVSAIVVSMACVMPVSAQIFGGGNNTQQPKIVIASTSDFIPGLATSVDGNSTGQGLPPALADRMAEYLVGSQRFEVLDRQALRRLVLEQRFSEERDPGSFQRAVDLAVGEMDELEDMSTGSAVSALTIGGLAFAADALNDFTDLGSAANADYLVIGVIEAQTRGRQQIATPGSAGQTITRDVSQTRLRLRVIDVQSASILGARSVVSSLTTSSLTGVGDDNTGAFLDELARQASVAILDMISPATIESTAPYVVTRGSNDGIQTGDIFEVSRPGQEIRDANGVSLGRLREVVGLAEATGVQPTLAVVVPTDTGITFRRSDIATLYVRSENVIERGPLIGQGPAQASGGSSGRYVLALGDLEVAPEFRAPAGTSMAAFTRIIHSRLESDLLGTGRFDMLDRLNLDASIQELNFTSAVQGADFGQALQGLRGADYLVLTRLDRLDARDERVRVPVVDRLETRRTLVGTGAMRLIEVSTGTVIASEPFSISRRADNADVPAGDQLAAAFSEEAVPLVMNSLFPFRIIGVVGDGTVYVNRGSNWNLQTGTYFSVFSEGEEMIDPDTGISFGRMESRVGEIEIISIEENRARARITDDTGVVSGLILRSIQSQPDAEEVPSGASIEW